MVRYQALDSWRGICALLVALFHFSSYGSFATSDFIRGSYLFVDFFFVLSGFVIAHSYTSRLVSAEGFGRFIITRFGRLFPLHAFMLAIIVAFEFVRLYLPQLSQGSPAFTGDYNVDTLLPTLALVHGLGFHHGGGSWNPPSWSISTELFAYLLFGLAVWRLGRRSLILFSILAIIGPILLQRSAPNMDETSNFAIIRCLAGFSAGVLTYAILAGKSYQDLATREKTWAWTLIELICVGAVVVFITTTYAGPGSMLAPFVFAIAVSVFSREGGYISKVLCTRGFLLLGALSYSIYLSHVFVLSRMLNVAKLLQNRSGLELFNASTKGPIIVEHLAVPAAALMVLTVLAVSYFTFRFVEEPGRDYFKRLASRCFAPRIQYGPPAS